MKKYIYGIIDSDEDLEQSLAGSDSPCIYNIPFRDIGIVVSELKGPARGKKKVPGLKQEKVIKNLMRRFTVLPLGFETPFGRKELVSWIKVYFSEFRQNLNRLRNKVEFNVQVIWEGDEIRRHIIRDYRKENPRLPDKAVSDGDLSIERIFEKYAISRVFKERAEICISIIDTFLSRYTSENRLEKLDVSDLLVNCFYLVEKREQENFLEAFNLLKIAPGGFRYLCSAPLPPYDFVMLDYAKEYANRHDSTIASKEVGHANHIKSSKRGSIDWTTDRR